MLQRCSGCLWARNARCNISGELLEDMTEETDCYGYTPMPEPVGYGE